MERTGIFQYPLDLGDLGAHHAVIGWIGYRQSDESEDDYSRMTIQSVAIDFCGQIIDVVDMLSETALDELKSAAWSEFPAVFDDGADAWEARRHEE